MIKDNIQNIRRYEALLGNALINRLNKLFLNSDNILLDNEKVFEYSENETSNDKIIFEAHKNIADIHLILKGEEKIFFCYNESAKCVQDYNKYDDYSLFESNDYDRLLLQKGDFVIFFSNEIHSPKHEVVGTVKRLVKKEKLK